jgi:hypothetical protein
MSGIPKFNFPAFFAAAQELRSCGIEVVSPAEIDNEEDKGAALTSTDGDPTNRVAMNNKTWGDFLARDVKLIADAGIQGIVFLPGWETSRGAKLEAFVGLLQKDFRFYKYSGGGYGPLIAMDRSEVFAGIKKAMGYGS